MRKLKLILLFLVLALSASAQKEIYFDTLTDGFSFSERYQIEAVHGDAPDFVDNLFKVAFELEEPLYFSASSCKSEAYDCRFDLYLITGKGMAALPPDIEEHCGETNNYSSIGMFLEPGRYYMECLVRTRKYTEVKPEYSGVFALAMALGAEYDPNPGIDPEPEPGIEPDPEDGIYPEPAPSPQTPVHQNYICVRTMLDKHSDKYLDAINYYDGLGRQVQSVQKEFTWGHADLVTHLEYDANDRLRKTWLPVSVQENAGRYVTNVAGKAIAQYSENRAFSVTRYEESALNRVKAQYDSGDDWEAHPVCNNYLVNNTSHTLRCSYYYIDDNGDLMRKEDYSTAELLVNRTIDEDGKRSYTFTNAKGQMVLQLQMDDTLTHDTYYVYDKMDNLCYVLPPMVNDELSEENLDLYAYSYKYDYRNRCIEKKLPGCDSERYVYDYSDHIIFSQNGNQKTKNEWTFILYDALGRETVRGLCNRVTPPVIGNVTIVSTFSGTGGILNSGYTAADLSIIPTSLLSVKYYDNYDYLDLSDVKAHKSALGYQFESGINSLDYSQKYVYTASPDLSYRGQLTGMKVYTNRNELLISAMYYDDKGNVAQSRSTNILGGYEKDYFNYTFTGKILRHLHVHSATGKSVQKGLYTYVYDHAERLKQVNHQLNNASSVILSENIYDELGRLKSKKLHGNKETLEYTYNIRNWLTAINSSKFTQNLHYTDGTAGVKCYNGNIASMSWKAGTESTTRGYVFSYDGLNRLKNASYGEGTGINTHVGLYNEAVSQYDKQGNILSLQRYRALGATARELVDDLTITHTGNQLKSITDAATAITGDNGFNFIDGNKTSTTEYVYDANGNLTKDLNKKITDIQYNSLNLPVAIHFQDGSSVSNVYATNGIKLQSVRKQGSKTTTTDYCGNVIYENGALSKILTDEGYVTLSGTTPTYHYYLKDHQGNNRVVIDQNDAVEEVNHYYPFGGLFNVSTPKIQAYKYNGKELDRTGGLDWYDYGARNMDAALGLFPAIDPLCEKHYEVSPYAYCFNNPVRFSDPNGKDGWDQVVGIAYGIISDIIPGTDNIRDSYTPNDPEDYNLGLSSADKAMETTGEGLVIIGIGEIAFGEGATAAGGIITVGSGGSGAIVGGGVAVVGQAAVLEGAVTSAVGAGLMCMSQKSKQQGYNRGKKKEESSVSDNNRKGGGKTGKKINQKREDNWKQKESELKKEKKNATTKAEKEAIQKKIENTRKKQQKSENHSNKGQGYR